MYVWFWTLSSHRIISKSKTTKSAHNLRIERGRYTTPKTPVHNRVCQHCPEKVEDEFNFLKQCSKYKMSREEMFSKIYRVYRNFETLSEDNKFIYSVTCLDRPPHLHRFTYNFDHILIYIMCIFEVSTIFHWFDFSSKNQSSKIQSFSNIWSWKPSNVHQMSCMIYFYYKKGL